MIKAKCKSYLSRISLAITIIFGQVVRNTKDLLGCTRNKMPSRCGLRRPSKSKERNRLGGTR